MFSLDISDISSLKTSTDFIQHLHKDSTTKNAFKSLWNKCEATDPLNIAGILCSEKILTFIKKQLKAKYKEKCAEEDILKAIHRLITEKIDLAMVRPFKVSKTRSKKIKNTTVPGPSLTELSETDS